MKRISMLFQKGKEKNILWTAANVSCNKHTKLWTDNDKMANLFCMVKNKVHLRIFSGRQIQGVKNT